MIFPKYFLSFLHSGSFRVPVSKKIFQSMWTQLTDRFSQLVIRPEFLVSWVLLWRQNYKVTKTGCKEDGERHSMLLQSVHSEISRVWAIVDVKKTNIWTEGLFASSTQIVSEKLLFQRNHLMTLYLEMHMNEHPKTRWPLPCLLMPVLNCFWCRWICTLPSKFESLLSELKWRAYAW